MDGGKGGSGFIVSQILARWGKGESGFIVSQILARWVFVLDFTSSVQELIHSATYKHYQLLMELSLNAFFGANVK